MVVDLGIRQKASLFTQLDQELEFVTLCLEFFFNNCLRYKPRLSLMRARSRARLSRGLAFACCRQRWLFKNLAIGLSINAIGFIEASTGSAPRSKSSSSDTALALLAALAAACPLNVGFFSAFNASLGDRIGLAFGFDCGREL
jgi:hypothetical protein